MFKKCKEKVISEFKTLMPTEIELVTFVFISIH